MIRLTDKTIAVYYAQVPAHHEMAAENIVVHLFEGGDFKLYVHTFGTVSGMTREPKKLHTSDATCARHCSRQVLELMERTLKVKIPYWEMERGALSGRELLDVIRVMPGFEEFQWEAV